MFLVKCISLIIFSSTSVTTLYQLFVLWEYCWSSRFQPTRRPVIFLQLSAFSFSMGKLLECLRLDLIIRLWFMVFKATFSNISVISWQSVLLVENTEVLGKNHQPVASHWQTLSHNVVLSSPRLSGVQTHNVSGVQSNLP